MKRWMTRFYLLSIVFLFGLKTVYSQSEITFYLEDLPQKTFSKIGIRGNQSPLSWDKSIELKKYKDKYSITVEFPESEKVLEFKFVCFDTDDQPTWENVSNRTIENNVGVLESRSSWNKEQIVDIDSLALISSDALLEDFKLIHTMVLEVHPGTYRYNTKEEIQRELETLEAKFSNPLTYGEAYLAISRLTAQLKCDHTKAGFNNQNKLVNSVIHYQRDKLPFTFRWIEDKMVVIYNASENDQLSKGTVIKSINAIPVQEIRNSLLPFVGADGATDGNRLSKLEVNGYDFRYNAFDIFYPLVFPVDSTLHLEIINLKGEFTQIEVSTLSRDERSEILIHRYEEFPKNRDDMWDFKVVNDSIGILTINSFGLTGWKAMSLEYKAYLKSVFTLISQQKVSHLILDIRENTGGNDEMANELFTYLTEVNFQFNREGRTRYTAFPESLKPFVQTWGDNPWYFDLNPEEGKTKDGYYIFKENKKEGKPLGNEHLFKGKLYLISGSSNTSLAFYTAYKFRMQKLGLIVGQETGGNLNDINGGQILFLRLPNSKIEIDFPVMGGFMTDPQPNTGVKPDLNIDYTIQDIISSKDLETEAILRIIKGSK